MSLNPLFIQKKVLKTTLIMTNSLEAPRGRVHQKPAIERSEILSHFATVKAKPNGSS